MAAFTNQATLTYNGSTFTSNITTGEIIEVLSAEKNAVSDTYRANDKVTYVISIVNTGNVPYTGLIITDDLGSYPLGTENITPLTYLTGSVLYYSGGVLQTTPSVTEGTSLVISGINVPANGNAVIAYEARTNQFASAAAGSTIRNTAVISGGGLANPLSISETITAADSADLSITKSMSPSVVSENGQLTYTFVIQNMGNKAVTTADSVTITDQFSPILKDITVTFNGAAWAVGTNYTYDQTTGIFATEDNQIEVPAAEFKQNSSTGAWDITPGTSTLVISGTI